MGCKRILSSDTGAVVVIVAVVSVALLSMAAVVIDAGSLYSVRREMQTAADASALAGVRELPGNPGAAQAKGVEYAQANRPGVPVVDIAIESTYGPNDTVRATVSDPAVRLGLARFLGVETAGAGASAVAVVSSPRAYGSGIMPFGVMSKEPSATAPFGYEFYESVVLKVASQDGTSGNFHFIALTDPPSTTGTIGSSVIQGQLRSGGTSFPVYVGAEYNTRPGLNGIQTSNLLNQLAGSDSHTFFDVASPPDENGIVTILDPDCPRLIICPLIVNAADGSHNWPNGTSSVRVVGLAWFFLEDWGGSGNDSWVAGRFIRPLGPEEATAWGPIDPLGAIGFRLTD